MFKTFRWFRGWSKTKTTVNGKTLEGEEAERVSEEISEFFDRMSKDLDRTSNRILKRETK